MSDELGKVAVGETVNDLRAVLSDGRLVALSGVDVMDFGLVHVPRAVDVDLHVEHLGGEIVAAVDGGRHELEPGLATDGLQPLGHSSSGAERRKNEE